MSRDTWGGKVVKNMPKKVSRIIWIAPNDKTTNVMWLTISGLR